jgi:nitroreductase
MKEMEGYEPGLRALAGLQREFDRRFFAEFEGLPLEQRLYELVSALATDVGELAAAVRAYAYHAAGRGGRPLSETRSRSTRLLARILTRVLMAGNHLDVDVLDDYLAWTAEGGLDTGPLLSGPVGPIYARRSSVRRYLDRPVPAASKQRIMQAGADAATSRNRQARRFALIEDASRRRELVRSCGLQPFVAQAGMVVVGMATHDGLGAAADVIISLAQMECAAVAEGLGTCWLGSFNPAAVAELVGLPPGWRVVLLMAIGHPDGEHRPQPKLGLQELFFSERVPPRAAR